MDTASSPCYQLIVRNQAGATLGAGSFSPVAHTLLGITASKTDPALEGSTLICPPNSANRSLIPASPIPGAAPPWNLARTSCGIPLPSRMWRPRTASKSVKLQSPYEGRRVQSLLVEFRTWPPLSSE